MSNYCLLNHSPYVTAPMSDTYTNQYYKSKRCYSTVGSKGSADIVIFWENGRKYSGDLLLDIHHGAVCASVQQGVHFSNQSEMSTAKRCELVPVTLHHF